MIIIGYQGIGKSTLAKKCYNYLDLESTNTWFEENGERKRWPTWEEIYVNFSVDLSVKQHYTVFTSSHAGVRSELMKHRDETPIAVCCPVPALREKWIARLNNRYAHSGLDKDYRALMNAWDRYTENIVELMSSGFPVIEITSLDYDLSKVIEEGALRIWPPMEPVQTE